MGSMGCREWLDCREWLGWIGLVGKGCNFQRGKITRRRRNGY
jgi:hypothetical protein